MYIGRTFTRRFPTPNVAYCIDEGTLLGCAHEAHQAAITTPTNNTPFIYVIVGAQDSGTSTVLQNLETACRTRGISTWWADMKAEPTGRDTDAVFYDLTAPGNTRAEIMFVDSFRVVGLAEVPKQIERFSTLRVAAIFIAGSLFQTDTLMMDGVPRLALWELNLVPTTREVPTVPCTPWYRNFSDHCAATGCVDFDVLRQKVYHHLDEFLKYNMVGDATRSRGFMRDRLIKDLTEALRDHRSVERVHFGIGLVGQLVKMVPDFGARYFKIQLARMYDELLCVSNRR